VIVAFIDAMRAEGHAVESICRVLREQGCQVAARTYRLWAQPARPVAARTISDAVVEGKVRALAWTWHSNGIGGIGGIGGIDEDVIDRSASRQPRRDRWPHTPV
jgi:hypothetical protein